MSLSRNGAGDAAEVDDPALRLLVASGEKTSGSEVDAFCWFLVRAGCRLVMSVRWSVGPSVGQSVGRSVSRSVG